MSQTKIEWTDVSWNPETGCTGVSEGCRGCYARRRALRMRGQFGYPSDNPFRVTLRPERLDQPLRWRKPRTVFVCSMGDLFHRDVPGEFINRAFAVMLACPQHRFVVLTKRAEQMAEKLLAGLRGLAVRTQVHYQVGSLAHGEACKRAWPPNNIILGVSVEDQATADERIPPLLQLAAAGWRTVVSAEPLLEYMNLAHWLEPLRLLKCPACGHEFWPPQAEHCNCHPRCNCRSISECDHIDQEWTLVCPQCGQCACDRVGRWQRHKRVGTAEGSSYDWCLDPGEWQRRIGQLIVGAETGPGARECKIEWVRSIVEQCKAAAVPVFVKAIRVSGKLLKCRKDEPWPDPWPEDLRVRQGAEMKR